MRISRIVKALAAVVVVLAFTVLPRQAAPAAAATYVAIYASHSGFVLDVAGASKADGASIVQWPSQLEFYPDAHLVGPLL